MENVPLDDHRERDFFHRIKTLQFCDILLLYRWVRNESLLNVNKYTFC